MGGGAEAAILFADVHPPSASNPKPVKAVLRVKAKILLSVRRALRHGERSAFSSFHFDNSQLAANPVGDELNVAALFGLFEHRRIGDREHHGHPWHVEVRQRTMLDRDLLRLGVDLLNGALGTFWDSFSSVVYRA